MNDESLNAPCSKTNEQEPGLGWQVVGILALRPHGCPSHRKMSLFHIDIKAVVKTFFRHIITLLYSESIRNTVICTKF